MLVAASKNFGFVPLMTGFITTGRQVFKGSRRKIQRISLPHKEIKVHSVFLCPNLRHRTRVAFSPVESGGLCEGHG
jgi:hypothetical protein